MGLEQSLSVWQFSNSICDSKDEDDACERIYDFCMTHMEAKNYEAISQFMWSLNTTNLSVTVKLAPLAVTVPVAKHIEYRKHYYDKVHFDLMKLGRGNVMQLLSGLEG